MRARTIGRRERETDHRHVTHCRVLRPIDLAVLPLPNLELELVLVDDPDGVMLGGVTAGSMGNLAGHDDAFAGVVLEEGVHAAPVPGGPVAGGGCDGVVGHV